MLITLALVFAFDLIAAVGKNGWRENLMTRRMRMNEWREGGVGDEKGEDEWINGRREEWMMRRKRMNGWRE